MSLILVVDDDTHIGNLIEKILTLEGHKVLKGMSGKEAIKICQEKAVDLVITDLMMPIMDGLDLIPTLRRSHSDLPIIAISGRVISEVLELVTLLGAAAILEKPFEPDALVALVNRILGKRAVG